MSNIDKLKSAAAKAVDNFDPNMFVETRDVLALLDELEAKDKQIDTLRQDKDKVIDMSKERISKLLARVAELEESHSKLREAMAGIHNTITGGGAYTPLAAILNASKRAYDESAAAAAKGEAS
ncbi:hypothetical protein [Enterobacter roggenkampii]|uniref:hypothetical protein n=1 Tax=Enterobacter roggenkampii TaxID=1812935 RepID=UPI00388F3A53